MEVSVQPVGGAFLVEEGRADQCFTPEDLPSEARLMARSIEEFVRREALALGDRIEAHEEGLMRGLVQKAGALGLLAANVPEAFGGLGLPMSTVAHLVEKAALEASFSVSVGAHTVIGTLPILYFGTPEQKRLYLPRLASGEIVGAFALSEANSGSDALAAQTRARLSEDGRHYLLTGTKMWTTNAGFADVITVFAKVDGERFTAFLVEKDYPGVSLGREEHKLGIRGSSTRRVILDDARVPVENVLGEVGKGYRVALYVLNIGRFNLGIGGLGASKELLRIATQYARQRVQFGQPIARFGLIRHKLAEMAVRIYGLESMAYRTAGCYDQAFAGIDAGAPDANDRFRAAAEEYAVEAAIMKFHGSEVLDFVVDEGLQIHGGFGYTEEFPMAKAYRDARINRIFEGTNEINRLTVLDQVVRRAQKGRLPLPEAAARLKETLLSPPAPASVSLLGPVDQAMEWSRAIRSATLFTAGQAWESLGEQLAERQEVVAAVADMAAALYNLESAALRRSRQQASDALDAVLLTLGNDACEQGERLARYALAGFTEGDTLRANLAAIRRLLKPPAVNTIAMRRRIADEVLERDGYPW